MTELIRCAVTESTLVNGPPASLESFKEWNSRSPHHSFECCSKYQLHDVVSTGHGRYRRSLSNFCSKRMQAPARCPVFDDVVSKHMALTRSSTLQSCNRVYTAAAVSSPVPFVSFDTPSSLFTP